MNNDRIRMSLEQQQKISEMLKSQGISETEIEQIINGDYEGYTTGGRFGKFIWWIKKTW